MTELSELLRESLDRAREINAPRRRAARRRRRRRSPTELAILHFERRA